MFKKTLFILLCSFVFVSNMLFANSYNADTLKDALNKKKLSQKSAAERLKAGRFDKSNLRLLGDKDINYTLPNGRVVLGILLPNNKVAPAIRENKKLYPACVTTDYILIQGQYNAEKSTIQCQLEASKLAVISGDDFIQESAFKKTESSNKIKGNAEFKKANKYSSSKNDSNKSKAKNTSTKKQSNQGKQSVQISSIDDVYYPPSRSGGKSNAVGAVIGLNKIEFGISKGTWIEAELTENVNSADSGFIQLRATKSILGRYATLPSGTIFFANKAFNASSSRLEASTNSILLPDGSEIDGIVAYIHSSDKTAGLSGAVVRQRVKQIENKGKNILLQLAANSIPDAGTGAGEIIADNVNESLSEIGTEFDNPQSFIRIQPQKVLLRTAVSF